MKNPALALCVSTVTFALLCGCSSSRHEPEENYFLIATNVKLPYWKAAADGLDQAGKKLGVRAQMIGPETHDAKAEVEFFNEAMGKKPTGFLIQAADADILKPSIDKAVAAGIPVITLDADSPTSKRLFFVGTNNYQAGIVGGKMLAEALKGKGNVIILTIPEQTNTADRVRGYKEVLSEYHGIKIVETINTKGDPRITFDTVEQILEKRKASVDAFICTESTSGREVADQLDRKHIDGKLVMAFDTDPDTLEWIRKGRILGTIAQRPYSMGYVGLQMLDNYFHHKLTPLDQDYSKSAAAPVPVLVDTGTFLLTKSNIDSFKNAAAQ